MSITHCPTCGAPLATEMELCLACAFGACAEPAAAEGGFALEGHEVREEIARGGAGVVYRAHQQSPAREVALKILHPRDVASPGAVARFRFEAATIASLEHPAILPVYAVGENDGLPWFSMKLATGGTLAERSGQFRGQWRRIAQLVATLADAVQFAHARGVLHRDLKPGNILFDEEGRPYISDFGIAKAVATPHDLTQTLHVLGTPAYLAPEVAEQGGRAATTASDVYGLGAVLYELLAGRPPFAAETLTLLLRQVAEEGPAPLPGEIPRDLAVIAGHALEKAPAARYASAAELAEDLRRWLEDRPIRAHTVGVLARVERWARRNPAVAALSGLLVLGLVAGGAALWRSNRELQQALADSRSAQAAERTALRESLLREASERRRSGRAGQRFSTLASLEKARNLGDPARAAFEATAALAVPDLRMRIEPFRVRWNSGTSRADFTPDLRAIHLAAAPRGEAEQLDLRTRQPVSAFLPPGPRPLVDRTAASADGRWVLLQRSDASVELWAAAAGGPPPQRDGPVPVPTPAGSWRKTWGPDELATGPQFSADGQELVLVEADGGVRIARCEDLVFAPQPAQAAGAIALALRGDLLVIVTAQRCTAWRRGTLDPVWTVEGAFAAVPPAFSPGGELLALAQPESGDLRLLDAALGAPRGLLRGHTLPVALLAWHPNGQWLATIGWDRSLRLWHVASGRTVLEHAAGVRALRWSADGGQLAFSTSHYEIGVADFVADEFFCEFSSGPTSGPRRGTLQVSPDGKRLLTSDRASLRLWEVETRAESARLAFEASPGQMPEVDVRVSFAFFDGPASIVHGGDRAGAWRRNLVDGRFAQEASRQSPLREAEVDGLLGEAVSADQPWVWLHGSRRLVEIGRPGRDEIRRLSFPEAINLVLLDPTGRWALVNPQVATVRPVLDLTLPDPVARPVAQLEIKSQVRAAFSPEGRWLAVGSFAEYELRRVGTWERVRAWPAELGNAPFGLVAFSPDGARLAVRRGGDRISILRPEADEPDLELTPPQALQAEALAWAPDGNSIYVLGANHRVFRWDLKALTRELTRLRFRAPEH